MATASPSYFEAANSAPQDLYTIDTDQLGKTVYTSVGQFAVLTYDSLGHNSGTDIVINNDGTFVCQPDLAYSVTLTVTPNNIPTDPNNRVVIGVLEPDTGNVVAGPVPVGQTLTGILTPGAEQTYIAVIALEKEGTAFAYPAQAVGAHIIVQAISGYTVA